MQSAIFDKKALFGPLLGIFLKFILVVGENTKNTQIRHRVLLENKQKIIEIGWESIFPTPHAKKPGVKCLQFCTSNIYTYVLGRIK